MSVGIFFFGFVASVILGYSLSLNYYGLSAGILWGVANALSLTAVRSIGIARAIPIWVSVIVLVTFFSGVFIFHELSSGFSIGVIGIVGIIAGVLFIGSAGDAKSKHIKRGIMFSVLAGLVFGICVTPIKMSNLQPLAFFFPMSVGILLFGVGFALAKRLTLKNEAVMQGIAGGMLWNIGNLLSIISISILGLAKAYPIAQASLLIAVLWGVFYFKEITKRNDLIKILSGAIILLAGVIVLGMA